MGFKQDFEDTIRNWATTSLMWKVVSIVLLLMSFLSIASIEEHVFKFKGFIIKGISLYRDITYPTFSYVAQLFGLNALPQEVIDAFILFIAFLLAIRKSGVLKKRHNMSNSEASRFLLRLIALSIMYYYTVNAELIGNAIGSFIFFFIALLIFSYHFRSWMLLVYFLFPVVIVSLIAGISNGLVR